MELNLILIIIYVCGFIFTASYLWKDVNDIEEIGQLVFLSFLWPIFIIIFLSNKN